MQPPALDRPALTRQRILDAALDLADAEGLDALSMRRLGAVLGVEAMSLYHHVPSKAALLDGLVALVLSRVPLPEVSGRAWEDLVRTGLIEFRRLMLRHRSIFPLVWSRPVADPAALRPVARAFAVLHAAGFAPRQAMSAWCTLLSYTFGYIECEVSGMAQANRGESILQAVRKQEGGEYGSLRLSHETASEWDDDEEYERGLRTVIAGLRAELARRD